MSDDRDPGRTDVSLYGFARGKTPQAGEGDGTSGNGQGTNPYGAGADLDDDNFSTAVSDVLSISDGPGNSVG